MEFIVDHPEIYWWAYFITWAVTIGFAGFFWIGERLWEIHAICLLASILFVPFSYPLVVAQLELANEPDMKVVVVAMALWLGTGYIAGAHNLVKFTELSARELIRKYT